MRVTDDSIVNGSLAYMYVPKTDSQPTATISIIDEQIENKKPVVEPSYYDPFRYKIKFQYNKELNIYIKHEIDTQNIYKNKQVPSKEEVYLMTVKKGLFDLVEKLIGR